MIINNVLIIATFIALIMILISNTWRIRVAGLAIVYLLSFISILQIWPVALASVKLIAGWMGVVLISASQVTKNDNDRLKQWNSQSIFRLLVTALIWVVIGAEVGSFNEWIPIPYTNLLIGLNIIAGGLMFASVNQTVFDVIIGVLTFLAGFDVIYSSLEGSALVTGIFALINIFISLLSTYFYSPSIKGVK